MRTWLDSGKRLTVSAGSTSGALVRLGNLDGDETRLLIETVTANSMRSYGPFNVATRWEISDVLTHSVVEGSGFVSDGEDFSVFSFPDGVHAIPSNVFSIYDDFLYQTLTEADSPWVLNSGSNGTAVDPAIVAAAGGVLRLVSGVAGTGVAADGSQVVCHVPMKASLGGLVFKTRLKINTAITDAQVCLGFTDVKTLELPASVGAEDAITTNATDAVLFVYDTGAATDRWFVVGVADDVDSEDSGVTGIAPVADVYQTFLIEVSADGSLARLYIDGSLISTLALAVTPTVDLFATIIVNSTTTTSKVVDVDYVYVGHNR